MLLRDYLRSYCPPKLRSYSPHPDDDGWPLFQYKHWKARNGQNSSKLPGPRNLECELDGDFCCYPRHSLKSYIPPVLLIRLVPQLRLCYSHVRGSLPTRSRIVLVIEVLSALFLGRTKKTARWAKWRTCLVVNSA